MDNGGIDKHSSMIMDLNNSWSKEEKLNKKIKELENELKLKNELFESCKKYNKYLIKENEKMQKIIDEHKVVWCEIDRVSKLKE